MERFARKLVIIAVSLFSMKAMALVDLKNANYAESWIDINLSGPGYDLKVQRTYNSRTLHNGMFGFGWSSEFETSLEISAEGNIVLSEGGAGLETTYMAPSYSEKDVDVVVREIIKRERTGNPAGAPKLFADLEQKLRTDSFLRNEYASKHGIKRVVKDNTKFLAGGTGPDYVVKEGEFYVRNNPAGGTQRFNEKGQLVKLFDRNSNYLNLTYSNDRLLDITDNLGRKLTFSYFPNGKVKSVVGPNGAKSEYRYEGPNDLSFAKNSANQEYRYTYDDLHNLVKVDFPDKTSRSMKYDSKRDWITSFKDVNGCEEKYVYESSKDKPFDHYWSTMERVCEKKTVFSARYEFWFEKNQSGTDKYLARSKSVENGSVAEVTYNEAGRPIVVNKDKFITKFTYNKEGLLDTKLAPNGTLTKLSYDPKFRKVSKLVQGKKTTTFVYDDKGNLSRAINSEGIQVNLKYDQRGRIVAMQDQAKRKINIQYDERFGKPNVIEREGVGKITVAYKASGEIDKVSPAGSSVAIQVASTFSNLLELIQPAGVSLTF